MDIDDDISAVNINAFDIIAMDINAMDIIKIALNF